MTLITSQPFYTSVLGTMTAYSGFVRVFVPQGSLGYLGKQSCGCCGGGGCKDPRVILEFAEGILVSAHAYAGGSRKAIPFSSGGIEILNLDNAPVQYLPGTPSLDAESECPCNPSERWSAVGETNFEDLSRDSSRRNPYEQIVALEIQVKGLQNDRLVMQGELEDLRQEKDNLLIVRDVLRQESAALRLQVERITVDLQTCLGQATTPTNPPDLAPGGVVVAPAPIVGNTLYRSLLADAYGDCAP